jgi:predicted O-methyltransferase YrrM
LDKLKPKNILEIGVEDGGSLNVWAEFASPDMNYIGVDINPDILKINRSNNGQKAVFICQDSKLPETKDRVVSKLNGETVDFLFIDGGHDYETVASDFEMYSPLVRPGGIIALHDIDTSGCIKRESYGVYKLWKELKLRYCDVEEFINTEADLQFGIGLIRV